MKLVISNNIFLLMKLVISNNIFLLMKLVISNSFMLNELTKLTPVGKRLWFVLNVIMSPPCLNYLIFVSHEYADNGSKLIYIIYMM